MERRLPFTAGLSLALHVGGAALWLYLGQVYKKAPVTVLSDVELLVKTDGSQALVRPRQMPIKPSTWNFLKMALPSAPRPEAPLEAAAPRTRQARPLDMPAKLAEARGHAGPKMEAPELNSSRSFARPLDAGLIPRAGGSRAAALAEPSRLEEVGARRAPKAALEMEALQEERAGGRLDERPQELSAGVAEERRPAAALSQPGALVEESRARPAAGAPSILPEEVLPGPSRSEARLEVSRSIGAAAGEESREPAARVEHKKKAIEITGPLARRKIVHWEVPQFPSWLAKRGIVEAEVHIRFLVNAAGDVIPDMRVESTSGFGDLDRLAMDSLRSWRFKPLPEGSGDQWGVVTFRFVLE